MRSVAPLLLLALLAAGCATPYPLPLDTDYRVRVHRSIGPVPNDSHIYFQEGSRIAWNLIYRWKTYCAIHYFDSTRGADHRGAIQPGDFALARVQLRFYPSYDPLDGPAFRLVEGANGRLAYLNEDILYLYRVEMHLKSPDQPEVESLICYRLTDLRGNRYPSLAEIRRALGDAVSLLDPSD